MKFLFFYSGPEYSIFVGDLTTDVTDSILLVSCLLGATFSCFYFGITFSDLQAFSRVGTAGCYYELAWRKFTLYGADITTQMVEEHSNSVIYKL